MANQVLFFAVLALLCLGLVGSLYCKECLTHVGMVGCLFGVSQCKAFESCTAVLFGKGNRVIFRVYGCFMSDYYSCGKTQRMNDETIQVKCCSETDYCNEKFLY